MGRLEAWPSGGNTKLEVLGRADKRAAAGRQQRRELEGKSKAGWGWVVPEGEDGETSKRPQR